MDFVEKTLLSTFIVGWGLIGVLIAAKPNSMLEKIVFPICCGCMGGSVVAMLLYQIWK